MNLQRNRLYPLPALAAALLILPLLAGTAAAQNLDQDQDLNLTEAAQVDRNIEKQVRNILTVYLRDVPFDWVEATVANGKVLLTGRVAQAVTPARIARATAKLDGVTAVYDNVEILPVSLFDDQIRRQAAIAVYSHPMFSHRVLQGSPSIHLVVAGGKVQLEGTVSSTAEARLAESLVRSGTQNFGVENNLVVTSRIRG
jgi:osmotically-inducible protein OsmY